MAKINIHPSLIRFTNNQNLLDLSIKSVVEIIPTLCMQHPMLKPSMLNNDGELTPYINIYINGVNIDKCQPQMSLDNNDNIDILTALVGG